MAREKEMQEFTRSFFQGRPDLSTLTHSIVRRRYLAHSGRSHLEPEEKQALKRLVEEELLKMQVDEAASRQDKLDLTKKGKRPPTPCSDPERKRFRFNSESGWLRSPWRGPPSCDEAEALHSGLWCPSKLQEAVGLLLLTQGAPEYPPGRTGSPRHEGYPFPREVSGPEGAEGGGS
ncbi:HIRA-interacting protein 3 isoform X3 [Pongo abelii]|uniref:HIRA interacting protein 3 n=1 Tax=Pongo abelii TaxID=9601 RepID=A0A2J8TK44_PONAB|nr:HIRA-interacting protein 3 isoform X3 [Pongo abelii]PNJ33416.1 HIRIP3 isoform 5 [Pongo abelii]